MKEDQLYVFGGVVCPETYLGTRMNEKALLFHTQLHEWSDAQKLSHNALTHSRMVNSAKQKEVCLPVKKLTQIEYWTRDVNKYYHPHRPVTAKSGSFMYIDVSKYNIKDKDKTELLRPKSAVVRSARPSQRPVSAITTNSVPRRRFFGTDLNTISNHLVESQFHYSAMRKNLYTAKSSGRCNSVSASETKDSPKNGPSPNGFSSSTYESETTSTIGNSAGSKLSDLESQSKGQGVNTQQIMQPVITSRSWSNKMLNVISIDDCKLACRYRPQKIKEARGPTIDYEELDRRKSKPKKKEPKTEAEPVQFDTEKSDSHVDADDENESEVEINMNSIHLSPDRNNNEVTHQIIVTEATPRNDDSDSDHYIPYTETAKANENLIEEANKNANDSNETDEVFADVNEFNDDGQKPVLKSEEVDLANEEIFDIMNSRQTPTSKTSYGRITTLYSNSETTKKSKPERKKKVTRTQRINHAIDDMIDGRKVMNSMTKDFDKRVAEFGRTTIEKQEGSETFKKMHSNLRRKIDNFMEYKGAMKTKQFFEKRRLNSNSNSIEQV